VEETAATIIQLMNDRRSVESVADQAS